MGGVAEEEGTEASGGVGETEGRIPWRRGLSPRRRSGRVGARPRLCTVRGRRPRGGAGLAGGSSGPRPSGEPGVFLFLLYLSFAFLLYCFSFNNLQLHLNKPPNDFANMWRWTKQILGKIEPCHKKFGRLLKCFGFFTN